MSLDVLGERAESDEWYRRLSAGTLVERLPECPQGQPGAALAFLTVRDLKLASEPEPVFPEPRFRRSV